MPSLEKRFRSGLSFDEMVAVAKSNVDLYGSVRARANPPTEYAARIERTGRQWHFLVLSEDWCGDAVNIVPWVDALAVSSSNLEMRIIARDENLDLMDQHLTNGKSRSIPVVLLLDRGVGVGLGPVGHCFTSNEKRISSSHASTLTMSSHSPSFWQSGSCWSAASTLDTSVQLVGLGRV